MRSWTLAAAGLLSVAVEAAPRQVLGDELETRDAGLQVVGVVGHVAPRSQYEAAGDEMDGAMAVPDGCPIGTVFVSTTTVDVTVYITPSQPAPTEEPCPDSETSTMTPSTSAATPATSTVTVATSTVTVATSIVTPATSTATPATTTVVPVTATVIPVTTTVTPATTTVTPATTASTASTTEPCPPDESGIVTVTTRDPYANLTSTPYDTPTGGNDKPSDPQSTASTSSLIIILPSPPPSSPSMTATDPHDNTASTTTVTPIETITASTTEPFRDETTTGLTTHMTDPPAKTPPTTTICVIDTAMTPVTKTTLTVRPPQTVVVTKTIYPHDQATGRPSPGSAYCGVKGEPAGTYFIAEFIEERPGVPVTEEGCYQFCDSVMEDTKGCKAYRYYPNELGAPRCKLYGMPVSYDVRDIDNHQPGMWYDLACGPPSTRTLSTHQEKVQRPQVQEKFTDGHAEGAGAVDHGKEQVNDHHEGAQNRNSTGAAGSDNGSSVEDTKNAHPDTSTSGGDDTAGAPVQPPTNGNDDQTNAQPQQPPSGSGGSSPAPGAPLGGTRKKGGLLGLGLGVPLRN